MAAHGTLELARRLVEQLDATPSSATLSGQARDVAPIVDALGYRDLAAHLRWLASE